MKTTAVHPAEHLGPRPGSNVDDVEHFEADLTFGGCRDPKCSTGHVEPTVDMS